MSSRTVPYNTKEVNWKTLLEKKLTIPMNQRNYSWDSNQIIKFLDDIIEIFEEETYKEKMGSIISFIYKTDYDNGNDIYDGQQRILTTITLLNVIGCLSDKLKSRINTLLTIDTEIDELSSEQVKLKDEYQVDKMPKIYCINNFDMEALIDMFNDRVESWINYVANLQDIENLNDFNKYVCKVCNEEFSSAISFKKHITKNHEYCITKNSSKLYNAFIEIYNYLAIKNYDKKELIKLYNFILNDIDIQYYECTDANYVSKIFDWENNRGKSVESLDVVKNLILSKICNNDKKVELYKKWEELKSKEHKIYKSNYGQKLFDVAIQIYNGEIIRKVNHVKLFQSIIDSNDTNNEINNFFDIVEKLSEIMIKIGNDKYGKLLNYNPKICLNWEAYMWLFLPIFYKTDYIDKKLIKLVTKWYFRRIGFKLKGFNPLCYSNEFIRITNKVLKYKDFSYYKEIEKCLQNNREICLDDSNYKTQMKSLPFKSANATYLLLFLETCMSNYLDKISLEFTLEHIHCQKNRTELTEELLIDKIGNLTLIEGKNSENGHKGNSSLGSKSYDKKIESYGKSSSRITNDLAKKYDTFTEDSIIKRTDEIVEKLDEYTKY
jgi:hypothetical protein